MRRDLVEFLCLYLVFFLRGRDGKMERDFMGLNSKESSAVVKEEVNSDGYKEIGIRFLLSLSFLFLP